MSDNSYNKYELDILRAESYKDLKFQDCRDNVKRVIDTIFGNSSRKVSQDSALAVLKNLIRSRKPEIVPQNNLSTQAPIEQTDNVQPTRILPDRDVQPTRKQPVRNVQPVPRQAEYNNVQPVQPHPKYNVPPAKLVPPRFNTDRYVNSTYRSSSASASTTTSVTTSYNNCVINKNKTIVIDGGRRSKRRIRVSKNNRPHINSNPPRRLNYQDDGKNYYLSNGEEDDVKRLQYDEIDERNNPPVEDDGEDVSDNQDEEEDNHDTRNLFDPNATYTVHDYNDQSKFLPFTNALNFRPSYSLTPFDIGKPKAKEDDNSGIDY